MQTNADLQTHLYCSCWPCRWWSHAVAQVAALGVGDLVGGELGGATAEAGPLAWEISVCGARPSTQLWGTTYLPLKISEWSKKMFDEEKQSKYILNKEKCCAGGETEVCRHSFRINLNSSSLLRLTSSVLMVSCTLHCLGGKYLERMLCATRHCLAYKLEREDVLQQAVRSGGCNWISLLFKSSVWVSLTSMNMRNLSFLTPLLR